MRKGYLKIHVLAELGLLVLICLQVGCPPYQAYPGKRISNKETALLHIYFDRYILNDKYLNDKRVQVLPGINTIICRPDGPGVLTDRVIYFRIAFCAKAGFTYSVRYELRNPKAYHGLFAYGDMTDYKYYTGDWAAFVEDTYSKEIIAQGIALGPFEVPKILGLAEPYYRLVKVPKEPKYPSLPIPCQPTGVE